jgi:HAD superfamily hydrolase (TIGR01509 family)
MIRALIFDFDGLIVDTEGPEYRAWCEVFSAHARELPLLVWAECIGRDAGWFDPLAYLEGLLGRSLEREALRAEQRARALQLVHSQPLLPGVQAYVRDAQRLGLGLAIASSGTREWVTGHLQRLRLDDAWHCVRCREDVVRPKPEPDLYLAALEALGVTASQAIAFEDSPNGIRAAKRAGLRCVAVPHGLTGGLDLSEADLQLDSLADMPLDVLMLQLDGTRDERT